MRRWAITVAAALFFPLTVPDATSQVGASADASTQVQKRWELGRPTADDLETRHGSVNDPGVLGYLQQLAGTLASAAGVLTIEVRLTRSSDQYAFRLFNRVLYISAGLVDRIEDEAELAGLLAHQLAHTRQGQEAAPSRDTCILASPLMPSWTENLRERERLATTAAISYLKAAGYDPAAVLDLFSKLAYEHPAWAKAIPSEDVLELRVSLESERTPQTGYRLDSSDFKQVHSTVQAMLPRIRRTTGASRPAQSKR